jgi:16S rRNA (guanine527-N7)-methyltransferase
MRSPIHTLINLAETDDLPTLPQSADTEIIWDTAIGWHPDEQQQQKFQQVYHAVLQGNRALNLTRITEPQEFWEKHLWDSMSGIRAFLNEDDADDGGDATGITNNHPVSQLPLNVIDVGTGAGFPGLPVAIACPAWNVTLLDSTRKKTTFLDTVIRALSLQNATTVTDRVEAIGRSPDHREQYDLALLRAVAPASVCAEYALPLLKEGGWAVLYRGQWTDEETEGLLPALELLGGELELVDSMKTPLSEGDRHCIILSKVAPTPEDFPRPVGIPAKDPL